MSPDMTVHDRSGLLLSQSPPPTDAEINQAELVGIAAAAAWISRARLDVKDLTFWQRLHQEMFVEVWGWAGTWRLEETNIGVSPHDIQPQLTNLHDDLAYWLSDDCAMQHLELLSRFHHRLAFIHPFPNGNGRWARLLTDALTVRELRLDSLVWAANSEDLRDPDSPERQEYIAAIKAGDGGDFGPLMHYLQNLNSKLA